MRDISQVGNHVKVDDVVYITLPNTISIGSAAKGAKSIVINFSVASGIKDIVIPFLDLTVSGTHPSTPDAAIAALSALFPTTSVGGGGGTIPNLATVATSGSYSDLSNKPIIPVIPDLTVYATKTGAETLQSKAIDGGENTISNVPTTSLKDTQTLPLALQEYFATLSGYDATGNKVLASNFTWIAAGSANAAPSASGVTVSGSTLVGQTLTGTYTYSDIESDAEGVTIKKWYRSDDSSGTNRAVISGATNSTYVLQPADGGKYIQFAVVPKALTGTTTGAEVASAYSSVIVAPQNLITFSEQFDDASWSKIGGTVTADTTTAPDGTLTADTYTAGTSPYGGILRKNFLYSNGQYTGSIYLKRVNWNYIALRVGSGAGNQIWGDNSPFIDLNDNNVFLNNPPTGTIIEKQVLTDGWVRLWVSFTVTGATGNLDYFDVVITDNNGLASYTPTGTEQVRVWGGQLNDGPIKPYSKTTNTIIP